MWYTKEELDFLVGCIEEAKHSYLRSTPSKELNPSRIEKFNNILSLTLFFISELNKKGK